MMKEENLAILWPCCPDLNLPPILQVDKSRGLHGAFLLAIRAARPDRARANLGVVHVVFTSLWPSSLRYRNRFPADGSKNLNKAGDRSGSEAAAAMNPTACPLTLHQRSCPNTRQDVSLVPKADVRQILMKARSAIP